MKHHSFQELTTRIVNLSTRNKKPISVTWSGTDAYTNPKTVNIPTLPSGTILTPHQFLIWLGYVIHEGPGHQTHSDLNLYVNTCQQRNNPQFSYILNLLEDIRIENEDIKIYPGDRKYLDSVHQFVDNKIPIQLAINPDVMGLIYKQLFIHHRNLDTNIIKGNLDPETSQLISEIDSCQSTQDCIILADKVVDYLKQKQNQQKQNQEQNQSTTPQNQNQKSDQNKDQNQNSGDKTDEKDQSKTDSQSEDAQSNGSNQKTSNETSGDGDGDGLGNESENGNESQQSNSPGNQANSSQSSEGFDPSDFNFSNSSTQTWQEITEIKNLVKELINQIENNEKIINQTPNQNLQNKSIFPPQNIANDRIYVPSQENLEVYNQTRADCTSQILSLKKMFRIYLQAQTKKSQIRGLEEGKLDFQRLHVISTGQTTIFKDQNLKLLPETAIDLVIDMSGSMNANISRTAAIILAEALNSISQIKLSISGFTTNNQNGRKNYNPNPNSGRQDAMDILQFKDFTEPYQKCKSKLGAITNSGFTPLGDAYGKAFEHIISRPEIRKIIFLITDGIPEFTHGSNHSDYLLMKKIHLSCKKYKIQTLGLGIRNCEFLSKYFDQSLNIKKISDLPEKLLIALKSFI